MAIAAYGAVLWDVDGTLADSSPLGLAATNDVLRSHGHKAVGEEAYEMGLRFTTPARLAWHAWDIRDIDEAEKRGMDLAKAFENQYIQSVNSNTTPLYAGIKELVKELADSNVPMGALSNANVNYVKAVLKAHRLAEPFWTLHGADTVPAPKPSGEGLLLCCRELAVEPEDAVYVGDSATDGQAAKDAGLFSIGVAWGSHPRKTLEMHFDVVVDTVAELRAKLFTAD